MACLAVVGLILALPGSFSLTMAPSGCVWPRMALPSPDLSRPAVPGCVCVRVPCLSLLVSFEPAWLCLVLYGSSWIIVSLFWNHLDLYILVDPTSFCLASLDCLAVFGSAWFCLVLLGPALLCFARSGCVNPSFCLTRICLSLGFLLGSRFSVLVSSGPALICQSFAWLCLVLPGFAVYILLHHTLKSCSNERRRRRRNS